MTDTYLIYLAKLLALNIMVVYGVNLLMGYAGQAFLAISATFGIGAYVCALLVMKVGLPMPLAWLSGGLLAGLTGVLAGSASLALAGAYLAMVSIAFNVVVEQVIINWPSVTAGPMGITAIPAMGVGNFVFDDRLQLVVIGIAALLTIYAVVTVRRSQWGLAFVALRDSPIAASSLGIDTARLKANAFFTASMISGLAGGLYSHSILYISPDISTVFQSILYVLMVVLGGIGTSWGPVVGATLLTLLPQWLSDFQSYHLVMLGSILLACVVLMPHGILPALRRVRRSTAAMDGPIASPSSVGELDLGGVEIGSGAVLSLRGLSKRFGGLVAVDGVDIDIASGTIHGLIGPNGSGKSTVVNLVSGFYRPSGGEALLDGKSITGRPMMAIARVGLIRTFQTPQLFDELSVLENLCAAQFSHRHPTLLSALFGLASSRRETAEAIIRAERIAMALGLDRQLKQRSGDLAQGDRRRLEIGRALAARPRLLILDEPAAGLPADEIEKLSSLLEGLRRSSLTLLLIEHHMDIVMRVCDRITVLDRGRVIADGSPAAVQADSKVRRAYLGAGNWEANMMKARRWVSGMLAVLVCTAMAGKINAQELVIGVVNPFTGPGADLGVSSRQGLEPAVEEINRGAEFSAGRSSWCFATMRAIRRKRWRRHASWFSGRRQR